MWTLVSSKTNEHVYIHGCGNRKTYRSKNEYNKNIQKCIRCEKTQITPIQQIFNIYIKNAKNRNIKFDINIFDFKYLIQLDCFYCGARPSTKVKGRWCNEVWYNSFNRNGLDRLDSDDPYSIDTVVPCCFRCNKLKGDMDFDEFIDLIESIHKKLTTPNKHE